MKAFSSADLYFLSKELKELEGGRIESFYFEDTLFYLKVFNKTKGHSYVTCKLGSYLYVSKEKHETSHPNPFISFLRKYLKNGFIEGVSIVPGERIVLFTISKKDKESDSIRTYTLLIEIFAPGNVILLDEEKTIINSLTKKNYKDRVVRNKETYLFPPAKKINLENLDQLETQMKESELLGVVFLATQFGMGSKYAEEIISLLDIDKKTPIKEINPDKLKQVLETFRKQELNPCIKKDGEKVIDFYPFEFNVDNLEKVDSFNEAALRYFSQFLVKEDKKEKELQDQLKKLEKRLKKQQAQKEQMLKDYDKYQEMGNKIYEHFSLLEEVLPSINKAAKEKGWDYVLEIIKSNEKLSFISKVDYKNNKIEVDLK